MTEALVPQKLAQAHYGIADPSAGRRELENGAVGWSVHLPHSHRMAICLLVRAGPRFESPESCGISHFLEHMLYRGIEGCETAHEQALAFEKLGGSLSASTATDHCAIELSVPKENFETALELLRRLFDRPRFSQIETERAIVREEILESLDEAHRVIDADSLCRSLAFAGHTLGLPITGTLDTLEAFDETALRAQHRRFYVGANLAMAVAGPIEPEYVLGLLEARFGSVDSGEKMEFVAPQLDLGPKWRFVQHSSSQTTLRVAYTAAGVNDEDHVATEMLLRILDDGMSARLYHQLCDERGLCYDVGASYEAYDDIGIFEFGLSTGHAKSELALAALLELLESLKQTGPTPEELDKAQNRYRWQVEASLDQPEDLASHYAVSALQAQSASLCERYERMAALDANCLRDCARRLFAAERRSSIAVGMQSQRARQKLSQLAMRR